MESELYALQAVAKKWVGGSKDNISEVLYSDNENFLKLLRNLDIPRKSRYLEIKFEWIKEQGNFNRGSLVP